MHHDKPTKGKGKKNWREDILIQIHQERYIYVIEDKEEKQRKSGKKERKGKGLCLEHTTASQGNTKVSTDLLGASAKILKKKTLSES